MAPYDFHRRVIWCLWLIVFCIGMVMFALYTKAQTGYVDGAKARWGAENWDRIMQFYFPHDHSHGMWFNQYGKNCCSGTDCFPARPGTVKWTLDGYRVVLPDGGYALLSEDGNDPKIKPNPDDTTELRPTVCLILSQFKEYQNYYGIGHYDSAWRVRKGCAWYGRPRL